MSNKKVLVNEPLADYNQPLDFGKVWLMFQETDKKFKETDRKMKELQNLFITQWGKLMETLVEGDLINLLKSRGIDVNRTSQRVSGNHNGNPFEFDIIAMNGKDVVVVEVKTTLRVKDVKKFTEKLSHIKIWMPELANKNILGAVAYLTQNSGSHIMAANKGLYVIRATGNSATIINDKDFKPHTY